LAYKRFAPRGEGAGAGANVSEEFFKRFTMSTPSTVFEVGLLFIKNLHQKNNELLIEITSTPWTMNELQ
jgi:hypothetical protein